MVATYSGPEMQNAIQASYIPQGTTVSYSDGALNITPATKDPSAKISIRVKVPEATLQYPYFVLEIQFANEDQIKIDLKYSGQSDSIKRSFPEVKNEAVFAFSTKSDQWIDIEFSRIDWIKTSSKIKGFNFYGVKQPTYYKTKNGSGTAS
ncbi:hypothetical protein [Geomonas azotofigens]|uniref:hypothetical protein n=1 Tax=Geomonas azotofigens TaxID=2843196 RepID=UPI001C11FF5F|nr:hypothetical protein [Geomonas azotofigens]MBU5614590.1 hypothetical protein [Geomonas azotofigens]